MAKKNFYAIKRGKNGTKDLIVNTWDECSKLVLGFNAEYKGFGTIEEAEDYLGIRIIKEDEFLVSEQIAMDKIKELEDTLRETEKKFNLNKKKSKKRKSKNRTVMTVEIPSDLYNKFTTRCNELDMTEDFVIKNMIKEWIL